MSNINKLLEKTLSDLKLKYFAENCQSAAKIAAEKKHSHLEFLTELAEGEAAERGLRSVERRLRCARLPFEK